MARESLTRVLMNGLVCLTLVLSNCGGGVSGGDGGGGGVPSGAIAGTWFGTLEDAYLVLHKLKVIAHTNNTVTDEFVDGLATNVTHAVAVVSGKTQIFSLTGSNGTTGGFYVDGSFTHAVWVDNDGNFAVMQKGATSHPTYTTSDAVGTWSGYEVVLNEHYGVVDTYSSTVTISTYPNFTVSNKNGTITGSFSDFDPEYGGYGGFWADIKSPMIGGYAGVFMTPDKKFFGGHSCAKNGYWPYKDCSFSSWNKQ